MASDRFDDGTGDAPAQGRGFAPAFSSFMQRGTSVLECWYSGVVNQTAYGTAAFAKDIPYFYPVTIGRGGLLDRIAFEVTATAATATGRCGIYAATSKGNIYPGTLIVDGGDQDCHTATGVKSTTINVYLAAGLYWFGVWTNLASPTLRTCPVGSQSSVQGVPSTLGATPQSRMTVASAYGALPATFFAGAGLNVGGVPPVVHVRFSS